MNRKQIVNENLAWPTLSDAKSESIVRCLDARLVQHAATLARQKTPPKHIRKQLALKKQNAQQQQQQQQPSEMLKPPGTDTVGLMLKRHIRLGINSATKLLESEPDNVLFVLVCSSCVPLAVLTRHLHIMCAMRHVPAACVRSLSERIAKRLNMNTISCVAVQRSTRVDDLAPSEHDRQQLGVILSEWKREIGDTLPPLANPLSCLPSVLVMQQPEEVSVPTSSRMITDQAPLIGNEDGQSEEEEEEEEEEEQTFGSNFISIENDDNDKRHECSFDNTTDFIQFDDGYDEAAARRQTTNSLLLAVQTTNRSLYAEEKALMHHRLNKLSIAQRTVADPVKRKAKKINHAVRHKRIKEASGKQQRKYKQIIKKVKK